MPPVRQSLPGGRKARRESVLPPGPRGPDPGEHEKPRVGPRGPTTTFPTTLFWSTWTRTRSSHKTASWSARTNKRNSEGPVFWGAPEGALPGGQDWGQGQWQVWGQGKSRNPAIFAPRPRQPRGAVSPRYDVQSARPLSPNHWGEGSGRWHQGDEQEMGGGAGARSREKRENQDRVGTGVGSGVSGVGREAKSWSSGLEVQAEIGRSTKREAGRRRSTASLRLSRSRQEPRAGTGEAGRAGRPAS